MVIVYFSSIDSKGEFNECSYGGPDIESCFDTLNGLTTSGWQLVSAQLSGDGSRRKIELPIEAFTGEPMRLPLQRLQHTWEQLLEDQAVSQKQCAASAIDYAAQLLTRVGENREATNRRIATLLERLHTVQARLEVIKTEWGTV